MQLKAENLGPVRKLDIKVSPGLNVLRGANGSGKSTVLSAVNYALTKTGDKPTPRDGTKAGRIEAFGVTATFTSRATIKGTLEVESLSGRLDLGDLINPGYEDESVNDARRIKRLLELSNATATTAMFAHLLGSMKIGPLPTDLVDAADMVKRTLQEAARQKECEASRLATVAAGHKESAAGVDVTVETDETKLQQEYAAAVCNRAAIAERKQQVEKQLAAAASARKHIDNARSIPSEASQLVKLEECRENVRKRQAEIDALRAQLAKAEQSRNIAVAQLESAENSYAVAKQTAAAMREWESQVAAAEQLQPVSVDDLKSADSAVQSAHTAIQAGTLARRANEAMAAAKAVESDAKEATQQAATLRDNAAATDDVLASQLSAIGCPWRPIDVPKGNGTVRRLIVSHKRGEQTLVSDLSEGERAKDAIDVALGLAGKSDRQAVLILRQEVFEGLQPAVRKTIDEHAQQRGVVILTAEATDDEEVTL